MNIIAIFYEPSLKEGQSIVEFLTNTFLLPKALSHIDALADAQETNIVVRHMAKYIGCTFISRSLIGAMR